MNALLRSLLFAIAVLTLPIGQADAQEWTRFRGPNGTGISDAKTVPVRWTEKDYNWRVELPAGGHSSPVLWGDRIFLTCADDRQKTQGGTAGRMVVCLSARDGKVLWTSKYASTVHKKHTFNSFASATPAVDADHVYVTWSTPDEYSLLALDHAGKEVWRRNLGPYISQHSCGTSPIVYEDMVVMSNDQDAESEHDANVKGVSFLIAVDRKTGETRWKTPRRGARVAYSTPCVYQPDGGKPELIFNSQAHGVTSINPSDGQVNWEISSVGDKPLLSMRSCSSPVLAAGLLTISCGSGAGGNYLVAVRPGGGDRQPQQVYKVISKDGAPYVPTPIAVGRLLFLFGDRGIVSCVDAASGKVHWTERPSRNVGRFFGSPVCVDNKIYCASDRGEMVVLAATEKFELLARNNLGELCHTTPAVAGGKMYLRTYTHLMSLGGK